MSSVKRSSLVSSELGQLKVPDKWETPSKTTNASATNTNDITCDTMSSSTAAKTQTQQQSRDAPKAGNSTQQSTKNFDLDDNELKNLLDEAYSYKGPKDKENKSEIFKELLHKVEIEDQQKNTFYTTRQFRGNSRRHHTGGSLQDLVDSVNNEQLDCDYILIPQSRRLQQNSRYTKNLSSVSSRQREGGSLPNNVNSSSTFSLSSFPLSKHKVNAKNSVKNKLEWHDYERNPTNHHRTAFIGESVSYCEEIQPSIASTSASVNNASDKNHTIINIDEPEEARHLLAHDSLAQDTSAIHRDDGTELLQLNKQRLATMNYLSNIKDLGEASRQNCSVDTPIQFLKYSSPTISEASLNKVYTKSSIDPKYQPTRHVQLNPPQVNINKLDENGNAILAKPTTSVPLLANPPNLKPKTKRSNKADRNTTTWTVPQGSDYNIDSIVAFIENTDTSKKTNNLSATERTNRKEKKNVDNKKKEVNRLKKSTSMEELKSSSKIEEEIAQSERAQVSLRQKQMQNAQKRNITTSENAKQSNNKRGERRSWGTEELNDFETAEDPETKKHKENKPNTKNNRKTEQIASTNASIESIPTNIEAAEFHVVTKKKKTKKRQIIEEAKSKQQMSQRDQTQTHGRNSNILHSNATNSNKYQPSSTYTNDRDIYVNSLMTKENRRKSTSSVPPSDKSDSSDLDSVHSLPIESTTGCTPSIISYAEMARKANQQPDKLANVNAWPSVSQNGKNSESPENSNTSTSSSTVSSKSHASNRSNDTLKAYSPCEEKSASNSDDSRTMDTPKIGEYVKNQLQKSKSCDNEKYTTTMSMDQFPGLEKTVKPQKSQPNFASILTSPSSSLSIALSLPPQPSTSTVTASAVVVVPTIAPATTSTNSTMTINEKLGKGPIAKKSLQSAEVSTAKENTNKVQKSFEDKVDNINKTVVDAYSSKLQFVQNSAKAEEIANSDSSNLFAPINMKKTKKSHQNTVTSQRTARQNAVIFSDREMNHENVSPLLFGDFNDDILQLMKQEENHLVDETANGPTSIIDSSASNCLTAYESADNYAINDCNQLKPNILTPMMSSQSDPGYASAHRTIVPTESHEMINNHQVFAENHVGNSTITELSCRKSNVTKKTNLNKINVNNKTSDVVSNQSFNNNNNMINNNISLGDITAKAVSVMQSISDSDSLNNNIILQMNDKNRHNVDVDVIKGQQHNDVAITKTLNAQNHVHNTVSKTTNNQPTANYQQKGITYDNVNNKMIDITNAGPKVVSSSNKLSSTENEIVPVHSHPANVSQKGANHVDSRGPFVSHNHNHNDIVHFVGSAWEEVKCGRAHYFGGQ